MSAAATQERTALVLYGSETGNAQDVAEELGRLAQRLHFSSFVSSLDAVEPVRFLAGFHFSGAYDQSDLAAELFCSAHSDLHHRPR